MVKIIQQNRPFFIGFCLWLIIGAILQLLFTQNELLLWVNRYNTSFLDFLFKYITNLGDGVFFAICVLFLLIRGKKQAALIALLVFALITGVFAYYLKEFIHTPRPFTAFSTQMKGIHLVKGVEMAKFFSFPSGHTLSAFSVFLIFSLMTKNKNWGIAYLLLAILVGYSRMYLFQHFAIDVYAGSIFGVGFTMIIVYLFDRRKPIIDFV